MNGKPRINPIEQQTSVRLGRDQVERKVTSPMGSALAGIGDLAQIMGQAMKERASAKEKYNEQLIRNWEEQLANKYKALGGQLNQSQDPDEYDSIAKSALDDMKSSGKLFLGEKLYKKWEGEHGQNYYNSIGIDVDNKKQGLYQKKAYELAKDTVKQMAYNYGYAETDEEREIIHKQFREQINDKSFSPIEVLALTESFKKESSNSRLAYLVDKSPQTIASVDKDGNVISVMDDPKQYTNLTLAEKVYWKNKALVAQKTRNKGQEESMQGLYQWAFNLSETNPEGLQQEVLLFRQNPRAYQRKAEEMLGQPVEPKKLAEMMNWTQTNLLDNPLTAAGQIKQANFAQAETLYKNFNITTEDGKTAIKNKDLNNVESLYEVVMTMRNGIKTAAYSKTDSEKVDTYLTNLTHQMGEKIMAADYAHNWLYDATGEHMLQNEIALFAKNAGLSPAEAANIYLESRQLANLHGLDLTQDYEGENAQKVEQVFSAARKQFYHRQYGVPVEYADAYLYDGKLVELQDQSKSKQAKHIKEVTGLAQQYKAYTLNGQKAKAVKDKDGRITRVYFEEGN